MAFKLKRDWSQSTIGKAHDTRDLTRKGGGHGNAGSLTFSFSLAIGVAFLKRFCNGQDFARVKLELIGSEILITPTQSGESGRKFSISTYGRDYRSFFDNGNYAWINDIPPFGATPTPTRLTDQGILMALPPENKRNPIEPYNQYRPRLRHAYPSNANLPVAKVPVVQTATVMPPTTGHLYLVMVPLEIEERFHTLLRFLGLEALRE